jgi:hypothetical protein
MDTAYLFVRGYRSYCEFMVGAAGALVAGIGGDLGGGSVFLFKARRRQSRNLAVDFCLHGNWVTSLMGTPARCQGQNSRKGAQTRMSVLLPGGFEFVAGLPALQIWRQFGELA